MSGYQDRVLQSHITEGKKREILRNKIVQIEFKAQQG